MREIYWFHKSNSGEIARRRLKLLLLSDKTCINPGLLDSMKDDMIGVLSRYAQIDTTALDIQLTRMESAGTREQVPVLSATFPIRSLTVKEE